MVNVEIVKVKVVFVFEGELGIVKLVREIGVDFILLKQIVELGRLLVVNFVVGGVVILVDVVFMMQFGCDGVFVGSGIFKDVLDVEYVIKCVRVIVKVVVNWMDKKVFIEVSIEYGIVMKGISNVGFKEDEKFVGRGW